MGFSRFSSVPSALLLAFGLVLPIAARALPLLDDHLILSEGCQYQEPGLKGGSRVQDSLDADWQPLAFGAHWPVLPGIDSLARVGDGLIYSGGVDLADGFSISGDETSIGASRMLWNVVEAETMDFTGLAMRSSVLAPEAELRGGAVFDGAVAVRTYHGAREFHDVRFAPPVEVSEPALLGLLLVGFLLLCVRRLLRAD